MRHRSHTLASNSGCFDNHGLILHCKVTAILQMLLRHIWPEEGNNQTFLHLWRFGGFLGQVMVTGAGYCCQVFNDRAGYMWIYALFVWLDPHLTLISTGRGAGWCFWLEPVAGMCTAVCWTGASHRDWSSSLLQGKWVILVPGGERSMFTLLNYL